MYTNNKLNIESVFSKDTNLSTVVELTLVRKLDDGVVWTRTVYAHGLVVDAISSDVGVRRVVHHGHVLRDVHLPIQAN